MSQDTQDYMAVVENSKYFKKFSVFQSEHPEIPADWTEFVEPQIQKSQHDMIAFVFSLF